MPLTNALRLLAVALWSGFSILVAMVVAFFSSEVPLWLSRRMWAPGMVSIMGVRVQMLRGPQAMPAGGCIIVMNHQSNADVPVLLSRLPVNARFVAKRALMYVPLLGLYMWRTKMIFVDRSNPTRAYESLERGAAQIREGVKVVVFPEGTRSRDGQLQSLKRGAFHMALAAQVPIVPVVIDGTRKVLPPSSLRFRPGSVRLQFGEAIDTAPFVGREDGVAALREHVAQRLRVMFEELQHRS